MAAAAAEERRQRLLFAAAQAAFWRQRAGRPPGPSPSYAASVYHARVFLDAPPAPCPSAQAGSPTRSKSGGGAPDRSLGFLCSTWPGICWVNLPAQRGLRPHIGD